MRVQLIAVGVGVLGAFGAASAEASWLPPHTVSQPGVDVRAATTARTSAGDALAVWVAAPRTGGPGRGVVMVAERAPLGRWRAPRRLSPPGSGAPAAALNPAGAAAVAFGVRDTLSVALRPRRGGGWRIERIATGQGHIVDVRVAMAADGRVTIAWSGRDDGRHLVRVAQRGDDGWQPLGAAVEATSRPALAVAGGGRAVASWVAGGDLQAVSLGTGVDGSPEPVRIGEGAVPAIPALAVADGGRALVAWRARLPGGTSVVAAAERGPEGWRTLGDLGVGDGPVVALGPNGGGLVAWTVADGRGDQAGIQTFERRGAGGWRPGVAVARSLCRCRYRLEDAAIDGGGGPALIWRRATRGGANLSALSQRPASNGRWRSQALRPSALAATTALVGDRGPGLIALWGSANGRNGAVHIRLRGARR